MNITSGGHHHHRHYHHLQAAPIPSSKMNSPLLEAPQKGNVNRAKLFWALTSTMHLCV